MLALPVMGKLGDASEVTAVVDYCGAGGESQGLVEAGVRVVQAANHFDKAIETHAANHRDTDHLLTDLLVQDPRVRPRAHIYQASPECTWHSPAGGRKRHRAMLDMFDDYVPDPAGERSRATMMTVLSTAEAKRFPIVIVENVVEVAKWEMFEVWLAGFKALGYEHQILSVSAAHIWSDTNRPAPQWRDRVYFVFYLRGIEFPDVSPRPWAHCPKCAVDVRAVQSWKKPGRRIGKYRTQYVYACPIPGHPAVEPYVMPALDALDLSDLGDRIADKPLRKLKDKATGETYESPLSRATLRRIRVGALMFAGEPEVVQHTGHTWDAAKPQHPSHGDPNAYHRVQAAQDPLAARTSTPGDALVHPYVTAVNHGEADGVRAFDATAAPWPTRSTKIGEGIVTPFLTRQFNSRGERLDHLSTSAAEPTHPITGRGGNHAMVTPFLSHQYGELPGSEYRNSDPAETPLATITAGGTPHNVVTPYGVTLRNHAEPYDVASEPVATVTAGGSHHGLATPFLSKHHGGENYRAIEHMNKPVGEPAPTLVGRVNVSLVTPTKRPRLEVTPGQIDAVDVSEFRFRMLQWREHANAQRFPRDYIFTGNGSVNTLLAGNAVATNVSMYLGQLARIALGDGAPADYGFEWLEAA